MPHQSTSSCEAGPPLHRMRPTCLVGEINPDLSGKQADLQIGN
jgi:hypothetical protein